MAFKESVARRGLAPHPIIESAIRAAAGTDQSFDALIRAVISRESEWNPGALRWEAHIKDASYGLMQILLGTARGMRPGVTPSDLFDPAINIELGARFLRDLTNRYSTGEAISAYNQGEGNLKRYGIGTTRPHVDDVLTYHVWYLNHLTAERLPDDGEPPSDESDDEISEEDAETEWPEWAPGTVSVLELGVIGLIAFGVMLAWRR